MGRLVVSNVITINGAFESPSPDEWLVVDDDSGQASLERFLLADAMVLGRKTYEGLAAVWPTLGSDPVLGRFADRLNSMPKYVASRTLTEPLSWNASLIHRDVRDGVIEIKTKHQGDLIVSGCGEFAHHVTEKGLVDEFWFWVNPRLWPSGPRIYDGVGPVRLELTSATPYRSGVLWLRYRPAMD